MMNAVRMFISTSNKVATALLLLLAAPATLYADQVGLGPKITEILPVDEAFRFGHYREADSLRIFWQVLPGYYLYRDKINISIDEVDVALDLPLGQWRDDEVFGRVRVLDGLVEVSVPLVSGRYEADVGYQGCAAQGYCYPPQKRSVNSQKESETSKKFPF